mmetsp:Transcript_31219/g.85653  ORF Transcript_31219/g.85653 Transcript_31219/m.85653 type:complete len:85 (-) Transcript_31219:2366-2620(-)
MDVDRRAPPLTLEVEERIECLIENLSRIHEPRPCDDALETTDCLLEHIGLAAGVRRPIAVGLRSANIVRNRTAFVSTAGGASFP